MINKLKLAAIIVVLSLLVSLVGACVQTKIIPSFASSNTSSPPSVIATIIPNPSSSIPVPSPSVDSHSELTYSIVDTGQTKCYDNSKETSAPGQGESFYGQDAQYTGNQPSYKDNGDGTITDLVTGLMWQKTPGGKVTYSNAVAGTKSFNLNGYTDWRLGLGRRGCGWGSANPPGWPICARQDVCHL